MKKLLFILTAASAVFMAGSCKKTQDFCSTFNVKGLESTSAYVTVFGLRDSISVDFENPEKKVVPITDGQFTLSGKAAQQAVIRVSFSDDKRLYKSVGRGYFPNKASSLWFIIGPGTKMKTNGDLTDKNFVDLYPAGDFENKMFAQLTSKLMPLQSMMGDLMVKGEVDTTLTRDDMKALKEQIDSLDQESQKVRMDFITGNPSCIAALWLMEDMLVRSQVEPAELEPLLEQVDKKYYENYFYYTVKGRVDGAKLSAVGAPCPRLEGNDVFGNPFNIKDMQGKFTIIDFWGTWCGACLGGMPAMRAFRDAHVDKIEIVGVANDKDVEAVKKCMEKNNMDWTNIMQGNGENDFVAKFNVQGFPTKIIVDPNGTIVYRTSGESEEFYKIVEEIINK